MAGVRSASGPAVPSPAVIRRPTCGAPHGHREALRRDAMFEAAARADQLLEDGDWQAAATWHRILNAIERLQAKVPAKGEAVH